MTSVRYPYNLGKHSWRLLIFNPEVHLHHIFIAHKNDTIISYKLHISITTNWNYICRVAQCCSENQSMHDVFLSGAPDIHDTHLKNDHQVIMKAFTSCMYSVSAQTGFPGNNVEWPVGQNTGLFRFSQGELGPVQVSSTVLPADYCVQVWDINHIYMPFGNWIIVHNKGFCCIKDVYKCSLPQYQGKYNTEKAFNPF